MTATRPLYFVVPGDINIRTGGYRYDKRIIEGLAEQGWTVHLIQLYGDYPFPSAAQRAAAAEVFKALPDHAQVIVDGLAFSTLPEQLSVHQSRLQLYALIHHPLALETGLSTKQAVMLKSQEINALQNASHVITTSPSTSLSLIDYEVAAERVTTICPGSDAAPLATGSTTDSINLLCVATLTARKGHSVLFDALKQLENLQWHLHCVGSIDRDSQTYETLLNQRNANGLQPRISFAGEADDSALDNHYRQADLFVLASYHEGYGMVLDEALAYGLPIVASNAGAISDTVPEGAGLLVPPGQASELSEALRHFMTDEALRSRLRRGAQTARQNRRSWQQASSEFGQLLANG